MTAKIDGKHRGAPVGTWKPGGGIEVSRIYFLCGERVRKSGVCEKLNDKEET